jgi:glycosyltransferase involved in cell wall biosynthesis
MSDEAQAPKIRGADMGRGPKLLYFLKGEKQPGPLSFAKLLEADGWVIDYVPVSERAPARGILNIFMCRRHFADYDVVAASEYFLTWALCLRLLFNRQRPAVVALSFNQSQRLIRTGLKPADWVINRLWRRVSVFHVHSRAEARLFAKLHDIPEERFQFSHWGYDLPKFEARTATVRGKPYVTMVGRNNRDLETFSTAVQRAGVDGVLITAAYMVTRHPLEQHDNVKVLVDRPVDECLRYVANSFAHLVLVTDAGRGAGHISAVSAMLLGKAQIFSDVAPLADYLIDDFNGIAVPVGDVDAVTRAIRKLLSDAELRDRLGASGKSFALQSMSDSASAAGIANAVVNALDSARSRREAS